MATYAKNTSVSVEKSKSEIEKILKRYGADQFMYGWKEVCAVIGFMAHNRMIRFELPIPDLKDFEMSPSGRFRSDKSANQHHEQAIRQRWRALKLVIQAKLEAVESGITTFEDEFLAHIILGNGQSLGSWIRPQLAESYERGEMPKLLTQGS